LLESKSKLALLRV